MILDIKANAICKIEINSYEAFRMLCKTLHMEFVLNEDIDFFIKEDRYGIRCVYCIKDGCEEEYDNRGDLFIALCNVAVMLFSDVSFRNAEYIYS